MMLRPVCQFCQREIRPDSGDKAIHDDGWCHELCWWKRECARLQAIIDELKDAPDGSYDSLHRPQSNRHCQHDLASEPTQYGEFEASDCGGPPTEAGEPCDD